MAADTLHDRLGDSWKIPLGDSLDVRAVLPAANENNINKHRNIIVLLTIKYIYIYQ